MQVQGVPKAALIAFTQHLADEVTTLATCWKSTRRDGAVLGFTDHLRDLELDGVEPMPWRAATRARQYAARPTLRSTISTSKARSRTTGSPRETCGPA
jgi:hypothetical protein